MTTKLEKLMFRIGLVDQVSAPLGKVDAQIQKMQRHAAGGGAMLAGAASGAWALQRGLSAVLGPAIEMERALGTVRTLGVAEGAMKDLERAALKFSVRYGESATDYVNASYDIKSAISTLHDSELPAFTTASGVLAKATKANIGDITSYMGGMYNVFQKSADRMGRSKWAEQLVGQTAMAVQAFRTTGPEMASFFESLGATATNKGWSMAEQMATAGILQGQMSASEGGTATKAFISGLSKAQEKLGIKFETEDGLLSPDKILAIINKLTKGMSGLEKSSFLEKNFGGQEAVRFIDAMSTSSPEKMTKLLEQFRNVQGMDNARKMAAETVDVFQRWQASSRALMTILGKVMLPVITPVVDTFTAANEKMMAWSEQFPHLTKLVGTVTGYAAGLVAILLALVAVGGVLRLTIAGLTGVKFLWTAVTKTAAAVQWLYNKALKVGRVAVLAYQLAYKPMLMTAWSVATKAAGATAGFLSTTLRVATVSAWGFAAALLANPITWIVVGVVALIAGLYLLVKHWDSVKAATLGFFNAFAERWGALRTAIEGNPVLHFLLTPLLAGIDLISLLFKHLNKIPEWFAAFKSWLDDLGIFDVLGRAADWLIGKLNLIPGINIEAQVQDQRSQVPRAVLPRFQTSAVPPGGISQEINNNQRGGLHIEKVELNQPVSGGNFVDELEMAAG